MFRNISRLAVLFIAFCSCQSPFSSDDYHAYFGGEIENPLHPYVLFYKNGELIDTLHLNEQNRFFKKFDSLTPGLYSFRHDPEFQHVYFDKNDSLLVYVNTREFDESLVYSGRGDQKNNYLMELYLQNEIERNNIFSLLGYNLTQFVHATDSLYQANLALYKKRKAHIQWSNGFDQVARAALDFPYFSKRELYPQLHMMHTGNDVYEQLPKDFYNFRDKIDFNDKVLANYPPYVSYLSAMLNNMSAITYHNHFTNDEVVLKTNLNKLHIADTLIRNQKVKNTILSNIANGYYLEDQNIRNNAEFLKTFLQISTDPANNEEIKSLHQIIQNLQPGLPLPNWQLVALDEKASSMQQVVKGQPTVVFFWMSKFQTHYIEAFKRVQEFQKNNPKYQFIAVNLDDNNAQWKAELERLQTGNVKHYRAQDYVDVRNKIAITRIHRTLVLDEKGNIKNAFTSLFDAQFVKQLQAQ